MGSILGRESEAVSEYEALIREALETEPEETLRPVLQQLFKQLDAAREVYWARARELHQVRETLKVSG